MNLKDFSIQLHHYYFNELAGINLTRISDPEEFYIKQVLDSFYPVEQSEQFKAKLNELQLMLDVGFGGGFPLIPLAYSFPKVKFIGIEARNKKCESVKQIAENFQLSNIKVQHLRVEDLLIDRPVLITFKAVGKMRDLLKLINIASGIECYVYFYKGPNVFELEKEHEIPKEWKMIEKKFYTLPGTEGRYFLGFINKNCAGSNKKQSGKELVKLSAMVKNLST